MAKGIYVGAPKTLSDLPVGTLVKDTSSTFLGEPVIWKIADINHEGYPSNSVTLITDKVVALRAFDAKEPNNSDSSRQSYGNSRYSVSNVRQWLNSDANAGQWYVAQHSADQAPDSDTTLDGNAYADDTGFLNGFSDNFKNSLLDTTLVVALNTVTDGGGSETVVDKMFLASNTEVGLANENNIAEGTVLPIFSDDTSRITSVTAEGLDDSNYSGDPALGEGWYWWLRTPLVDYAYYPRRVSANGSLSTYNAYRGLHGVRPLCNIRSSTTVSTTPDEDGCYTLFTSSTGISRKVKKAYVGVDSKARKIKKGYIGVGGIARLFYSGEKKLAYYGYIGDKFTTATNLVGGSVGNYAMFNEGQANKQTVAYNSSLVATAPDDLHNRRYDMTAITVGLSKEYLLFCGGTIPVSYMQTSAVDVYDSNLTKGTNLALSQLNASQAGGSINGYGVVAGGDWGSTTAKGAMVEFFSSALVRSLASDLSEQRSLLASVVIKGEYILFGGGSKVDGSYSSKVDVYDKNLVKKTDMALSTGKNRLLGAATEACGLFAGGYNGTCLTTVDTFNSQLVRGTATNLSHAHYNGGRLSLRGYALFISGCTSNSSSSADKRVSSYDNNLLKQELSIGEARKQCFGATVENFGIVVGGGSVTAEAFEVLE